MVLLRSPCSDDANFRLLTFVFFAERSCLFHLYNIVGVFLHWIQILLQQACWGRVAMTHFLFSRDAWGSKFSYCWIVGFPQALYWGHLLLVHVHDLTRSYGTGTFSQHILDLVTVIVLHAFKAFYLSRLFSCVPCTPQIDLFTFAWAFEGSDFVVVCLHYSTHVDKIVQCSYY